MPRRQTAGRRAAVHARKVGPNRSSKQSRRVRQKRAFVSVPIGLFIPLSLSSFLHPSAVIVIVLRSPSNPPAPTRWMDFCLLTANGNFGTSTHVCEGSVNRLVLTLRAGLIVFRHARRLDTVTPSMREMAPLSLTSVSRRRYRRRFPH